MSSKKIRFKNAGGQMLSARIALLNKEKVRHFAVFAHCFTCHKNLSAVRNISRSLNAYGIAVLHNLRKLPIILHSPQDAIVGISQAESIYKSARHPKSYISLDGANLMMPLTFFVSPTDKRILSTLEAIMKTPDQGGLVSDSLVYRYNVEETQDGLRGEEGTFNICTFWLVEALTRAGKNDKEKLAQARLMFEQMLTYANHLGLYAEETGPHGEALGNFPQAFTHLSLISAAYNLNKALK